MIPMPARELAAACGARIDGDPEAIVTSVSTDSRAIEPGALFVALPGERHDGAAFADAARAAGAVAALTSVAGEGTRLIHPDPQAALARIGGEVRARSGARVVAITGSSGKTLTKDFTAAALATQRRVVASRASFNNEIGVPLTLCSIEADTEIAVVEVGSRGPGHIAALSRSIAPDVSVVVNVGEAHLGMFGSLEITQAAKAELVEALGDDGVAVLNADDARTRAMASLAPDVVWFGRDATATVRAAGIDLDETAHASVRVVAGGHVLPLRLPVPGEHLVHNALAALAVCVVEGIDLGAAAAGIETAPTSPGRMRVVHAGSRIVLDDAYNANPASMRAALRTLAHLGSMRPTWAALGVMAELGDSSIDAHDAIGRLATRLGIGRLVVVGDEAAPIARAAILEGMPPESVRHVADADEATAILAREAEADAAILVKASRAAGLERIVEALANGHEVLA